MPVSIMDYMTLIAGVFTIAAAVATIFGVSFAIGTYGEWKKSHRYLKVIDFDTTLNRIERVVDSGLRSFWLYQSSVISGAVNQVFLEEYESSLESLNELIARYEIQGSELIRMGQSDLGESMVRPIDILALVFGAHKNTMAKMVSMEELNKYYWSGVLDKNEKIFYKMNQYLDSIKI